MVIYKYQVTAQVVNEGVILLPHNAEPLSVGVQGGRMMLWALVDPQTPLRPWAIRVYGTGHEVADGIEEWKFLGTVILGEFVFHVWIGE